jgi:allophanate hydrolase subunit 1
LRHADRLVWIGRTPVKMSDPRREQVFLAGIGDEIFFGED